MRVKPGWEGLIVALAMLALSMALILGARLLLG
jgi:hypothetical protein